MSGLKESCLQVSRVCSYPYSSESTLVTFCPEEKSPEIHLCPLERPCKSPADALLPQAVTQDRLSIFSLPEALRTGQLLPLFFSFLKLLPRTNSDPISDSLSAFPTCIPTATFLTSGTLLF